MQFFPDGRIKFAVDGKRFGGKGNGSRFDVTYSVDATTTPWHLDVIAKRDGVEVGVLRGLLEVIDDSTIRVGFDTTSKQGFAARPAGFSSLKPESIILLKKEPDPSSGPNPASQGRLP